MRVSARFNEYPTVKPAEDKCYLVIFKNGSWGMAYWIGNHFGSVDLDDISMWCDFTTELEEANK